MSNATLQMTDTEIANLAHAHGDKIVAGMGIPADKFDVARTVCGCAGINPDSRQGELYQSRIVGHWINLECGTAGC